MTQGFFATKTCIQSAKGYARSTQIQDSPAITQRGQQHGAVSTIAYKTGTIASLCDNHIGLLGRRELFGRYAWTHATAIHSLSIEIRRLRGIATMHIKIVECSLIIEEPRYSVKDDIRCQDQEIKSIIFVSRRVRNDLTRLDKIPSNGKANLFPVRINLAI